MYKLIAIDMDGTLLTPELEISQETVDVVRRVIDKKVIITLSTGRMYMAALPFANLLQLDVPIITCNGAVTKCSRTGKIYDIKTLGSQYSNEIINYCIEEGLTVSIYDNDEVFVEENSRNIYIHKEIDNVEPRKVQSFSTLKMNSIVKLLFSHVDKDKLEYHSRILYQRYKEELNFYFSLPYFVEIVNKNASKKSALQKLSKEFNIKSEDIIAIGDNFNDMDMIEYAGLGVAMGNAPRYLKEAADFVTRSNDEDGVRYVLERFILDEVK